MENEVFYTEISEIRQDSYGIIHITALQNAEVTLEKYMKIYDIVAKMTDGKKVAFLMDIRKVRSVDHEVRSFASSEKALKMGKAVAILYGSPVSMVIANLLIGFNKPPYPLRIFNREENALNWLKSVTNE